MSPRSLCGRQRPGSSPPRNLSPGIKIDDDLVRGKRRRGSTSYLTTCRFSFDPQGQGMRWTMVWREGKE
jgi:hypothetical protein